MKVLVADKFEKSGLDELKALGCDVVCDPGLKDDALTQAIAASGADVLIVRGRKVTTPMLDAGRWNKQEYAKAQVLHGRMLGPLGVGSIGREMILRAAGFGLDVVVWSRRFDGEDRPLGEVEAKAHPRPLGPEPVGTAGAGADSRAGPGAGGRRGPREPGRLSTATFDLEPRPAKGVVCPSTQPGDCQGGSDAFVGLMIRGTRTLACRAAGLSGVGTTPEQVPSTVSDWTDPHESE